jgi:hypothetical protein
VERTLLACLPIAADKRTRQRVIPQERTGAGQLRVVYGDSPKHQSLGEGSPLVFPSHSFAQSRRRLTRDHA